ncbi:SpoIIE family protein phosphatase [Actinacidiphila rubida]|nr:SpoIIE family protein phosphatase [Actinacidiphila rubida]
MDVLGVAAVVLDAEGRVVLWSPQAQELFGWSAEEVLGRPAAGRMVADEHIGLVLELFSRVMGGGEPWAGVFPVRHKDGTTRPVEFRNVRLQGEHGEYYALGLATDATTLRDLERDVALTVGLVSHSPIGLAVLDEDLRYVLVNPVMEHITGIRAEDHLGRSVSEVVPKLDTKAIEADMRQVLATGKPLLDRVRTGRTAADPGTDHTWNASYYRLQDPSGRVIGVAISVVDITDQYRAAAEAAEARRRLAVIANASVRIGTTLDLERTARELADVVVTDLADLAAVDVLDAVLRDDDPTDPGFGPANFRALAMATSYATDVMEAADPAGEIAAYGAHRLVTRSARTRRPILVPHVRPDDLRRIARDERSAARWERAGLHSYLIVPLIARGQVLGVLDLARTRNPNPFTQDDLVLAGELAARAAVAIDNARWYQRQRHAAVALQRHLLPQRPPELPGLEVAYRYQPAGTAQQAGGDWFDTIRLGGDKTALVVGDVMGHGINAAATMGQLRTVTRTLARLDLDPAEILGHLDKATLELDEIIATCVYAVYDPQRGQCRISLAGHPPPVLDHAHRPPVLLDLPTGAPLGVGGVPFTTTTVDVEPGDRLVLYTDGLVESRRQAIGDRLRALLDVVTQPRIPLEDTCDRLLAALPPPDHPDDIALLVAEVC